MKRGVVVALVLLGASLTSALGAQHPPRSVTEFTPTLRASNGVGELAATVRRYVSGSQVPFVVRYELDLPLTGDLAIHWSCEGRNGNVALLPHGVSESEHIARCPAGDVLGFQRPPPVLSRVSEAGKRAVFILSSNFFSYDFHVRIDHGGTTYTWSDTNVFLPLHNLTPIALDATQYFPIESIRSVTWSAANGDASDASTFPIASPTSTTTTMESQWPNVLNVTANVNLKDGTRHEFTTEVLIFFRDGTPFPIRSTAVFFNDYFPEDLGVKLDEMFTLLPWIGFNSVTNAIVWYHDTPDARGVYTLFPVFFPHHIFPSGRVPCTTTPNTVLFEYYRRAKEEGFIINVEIRPFGLPHVSPEFTYGPPITTRGFFYGDGKGLEHMLKSYADLMVSSAVDIVFLGAETAIIEERGGSLARGFFSDIMDYYRQKGFQGKFSYAINWYYPHEKHASGVPPFITGHIYFPSMVGIPWSKMDFVGLTFYSKLADKPDATTAEMLTEARRQIEKYIVPLSRANNRQIFIEDFYGFPFDGMGMDPLKESGAHDFEEQRRWTTAWLRAFTTANSDRSKPLIAGITAYIYHLLPNWYSACWKHPDAIKANLNHGMGRFDLQKLLMVYFRDIPRE